MSPLPHDLVIGSDPERLETMCRLLPGRSQLLTWWEDILEQPDQTIHPVVKLGSVVADVHGLETDELKKRLTHLLQALSRYSPARFYCHGPFPAAGVTGWHSLPATPTTSPPVVHSLQDLRDQLLERAVDLLDRWRSTDPLPAAQDRRNDFLLQIKDQVLSAAPADRDRESSDVKVVCALAYDAALFHHWWQVRRSEDGRGVVGGWALPEPFDTAFRRYMVISPELRGAVWVKASKGLLLAALVVAFSRMKKDELVPVPPRPVLSLSGDAERVTVTLHAPAARLLDEPHGGGFSLRPLLDELKWWSAGKTAGLPPDDRLSFSLPRLSVPNVGQPPSA